MLCSLPIVYMYVRFYGEEVIIVPNASPKSAWSSVELVTYSTHFGLCLALFLLTCFADKRPPLHRRLSNGGKASVDAFIVNGTAVELKSVSVNGDKLEGSPLVEKRLVKEGNDNEIELKECPELEASYLSQLTYWWFNSLAVTGFKKSLTMEDLWRLNPNYMTNAIAPIFDDAWLKQIKMHPVCGGRVTDDGTEVIFVQAEDSKPGVVRALLSVFGLYFFSGAIFKVIHDLLQFANPLMLK